MKEKLDLDKERKDRSLEEMAQEADEYRSLMAEETFYKPEDYDDDIKYI